MFKKIKYNIFLSIPKFHSKIYIFFYYYYKENPNLLRLNINIEIKKGNNENSKNILNINELNIDFKINNKRQYGIELLIILVMFMIIYIHLGNISDFKKHQNTKQKIYIFIINIYQ